MPPCHKYNEQHWKDLDPDYIQSRWIHREDSRVLLMCAALFGVVAWFFLIVPIVQSAWILSKGGKRLVGPHIFMASVSDDMLKYCIHCISVYGI